MSLILMRYLCRTTLKNSGPKELHKHTCVQNGIIGIYSLFYTVRMEHVANPVIPVETLHENI